MKTPKPPSPAAMREAGDLFISGDAFREGVIQAFARALDARTERAAKVAWKVASNSRADSFEDLRDEVDKAIREDAK